MENRCIVCSIPLVGHHDRKHVARNCCSLMCVNRSNRIFDKVYEILSTEEKQALANLLMPKKELGFIKEYGFDIPVESVDPLVFDNEISDVIDLLGTIKKSDDYNDLVKLKVHTIDVPDVCKKGVKNDDGKLRWSLLPWIALIKVVKVYNYGAIKYADRNWEKGIKYSRLYDAALRHLTAFWNGESRDEESGLLHLSHCTFNILAILYFELTNPKTWDDRPTFYENKKEKHQ